MPQAEIMPLAQQLKLMIKMHELETQGRKEEAASLKRQVPLPAYLAKFAKEHMGVEFVKISDGAWRKRNMDLTGLLLELSMRSPLLVTAVKGWILTAVNMTDEFPMKSV